MGVAWLCVIHADSVPLRPRALPAAEEHSVSALVPHACPGVMWKQWDHRRRVGLGLQPVFLSCTKCLLKTHRPPLRMGSARPSNRLCRQRHSVPQWSLSPRVTQWSHRGSDCQPYLAEEQHQCPAKYFVFPLKLQPGWSRESRLSGHRLSCGRSVSYR